MAKYSRTLWRYNTKKQTRRGRGWAKQRSRESGCRRGVRSTEKLPRFMAATGFEMHSSWAQF